MISLKIDQNIIVDYALNNGLNGDDIIQYNGNIPDNFYEDFKPSFFMVKNNEITENPDYINPNDIIPNVPSDLDKAVAALTLQMAKQSEKQISLMQSCYLS
ncbi:hypothetical protein BIY40_00460 [Pediococcus acidilactici]|nr:hypothetical protein BIY40_00460 [Pediococcus acidilactici]